MTLIIDNPTVEKVLKPSEINGALGFLPLRETEGDYGNPLGPSA